MLDPEVHVAGDCSGAEGRRAVAGTTPAGAIKGTRPGVRCRTRRRGSADDGGGYVRKNRAHCACSPEQARMIDVAEFGTHQPRAAGVGRNGLVVHFSRTTEPVAALRVRRRRTGGSRCRGESHGGESRVRSSRRSRRLSSLAVAPDERR